jgi:hypothetical protein
VNPLAVSSHIEPKYKYLSGDVNGGSWVFDPGWQTSVLVGARGTLTPSDSRGVPPFQGSAAANLDALPGLLLSCA